MAGGMHGRGHVWQGDMHGRVMHGGGMHGRGCAWQRGVHGQVGDMRGRYYEIRSMSGRYASYWNAFLFLQVCLTSPIVCPVIHVGMRSALGFKPRIK